MDANIWLHLLPSNKTLWALGLVELASRKDNLYDVEGATTCNKTTTSGCVPGGIP